MIYRDYPSTQMSDLNLDWFLSRFKETSDSVKKVEKEWSDLKKTASDIVIDEVNKEIADGQIGQIVSNATKESFDSLTKRIDSTDANVAKLQTDLLATKKVVDRLTNRKFILIGDSYSIQWGTNTYGWITGVKNLLPSGTTVYSNGKGGYGFDGGSGDFLTLLKGLENTIPDSEKSEITDIYVFGGLNERASTTNIRQSISNFCLYAREKYPNAIVSIGCLGWCVDYSEAYKVSDHSFYHYYMGACENSNARYVHSEWICHDYTLFQTDGYHLTDDGIFYISRCIHNIIQGVDPCAIGHYRTISRFVNPQTQVWTDNYTHLVTAMIDGTCTLTLNANLNIKWTTAKTFKNNVDITLIAWENKYGYVAGNTARMCNTPVILFDNTHGKPIYGVLNLLEEGGKNTTMRFWPYLDVNIEEVTEVTLTPFTMTIPWKWC